MSLPPSVSTHATLVRPDASSSANSVPIVPGSPMPHMYESSTNSNGSSNSNPGLLSPISASIRSALPSPRGGCGDNFVISTATSTSPPATPKKFKIYYCLEMTQLAQQIVKLDDRFVLADIQWEHFPDGFPNLFITAAEQIKNFHVCFLANFHSPSVFFEQFSVITAIPKLLPKSFKLFLPFFPTGTMERVSRLGEVATANSLARVLSTIPNCSKGPAQICIFDIHALQNQFYFKDTVLIRLGTCVNLLLDRIRDLPDVNNVNIAFPDDGAAKRFGDMFPSYCNIIICHKVRDGDKRVVKMKEGDTKGKHCIIVDDLVQSGGTLEECAKELLRNGAACVSAYVTHAIFPKQSYKKFFNVDGKQSIFKYFWVTDSNPKIADLLKGQAPFEVLSIAQNIKDIILDEFKSE